MCIILGIENQKGGCGKTTTSIQIADYAANVANQRTLIIDSDPSRSLTKSLVPRELQEGKDLYAFMMTPPVREVEYEPFYQINDNLFMLSATKQLKAINMLSELDSPLLLKTALDPFKDLFDVIVIDGSPEITQLTHNLFAAADKIIIPMNPGIYSIEGLVDLSNEIEQIKRMYNPTLKIEGLLLTNVDRNTNAEKAIQAMVDTCCEKLQTKKFDTTIYHSTVVNDAQLERQPIRMFKKNSPVYKSYMQLCEEIFVEV